MNRWITNIERREWLEQELARHTAAGETFLADLDAERLKRNERDMALIAREHPGFVIGPPLGTGFKSAEEIAADGYCGVYQSGTTFKEK